MVGEPDIIFLKLENNNGIVKEIKKRVVSTQSTGFVSIDDFDYNL